MRRLATVLGVVLSLGVVASAASAKAPNGNYSGTTRTYQHVGGPHKVSLRIEHGRVSDLKIGPGKVSCGISNESGPGSNPSEPRQPGTLSHFPSFRLISGEYVNTHVHYYNIGKTFKSSRTNGGWKPYTAFVLAPGPIYVSFDLTGSSSGSKFTGAGESFDLSYTATSSGHPSSTGGYSCAAEGSLTLKHH